MIKSKLWKFKRFLIVAILVLIAVAAMPASVTYFTDSFKAASESAADFIVIEWILELF